ncbi:MAG: type II secretion system F family protein [Candidatus Micrarchaeia archaeon]
MFFGKKKKIIVNGKEIELEGKPLFKSFSFRKSNLNKVGNEEKSNISKEGAEEKAEEKSIQPQKKSFNLFFKKTTPNKNAEIIKVKSIETPHIAMPTHPITTQEIKEEAAQQNVKLTTQTFFVRYSYRSVSKYKGLADALREQHITPDEFIKKNLFNSILIGASIAVILFLLFPNFNISMVENIVFSSIIGFLFGYIYFKSSIKVPLQKKIQVSKHAEKDILFAAREIIISLRSGMPLFNAIVSVSQGYGDASVGFKQIVENVQLGMPLQDAIDEAITNSKSTSFRRLMIQASMSIRIGSDIIEALQSVINQLSEERVIELRSYGQRLNALAMFYMLFGVILPSMGIAVATILTTFIPIITINLTMLALGLVGILFLQFMFLQMVRSGRPIFSM